MRNFIFLKYLGVVFFLWLLFIEVEPLKAQTYVNSGTWGIMLISGSTSESATVPFQTGTMPNGEPYLLTGSNVTEGSVTLSGSISTPPTSGTEGNYSWSNMN